jgi:bacterioferritin
MSASSAQSSVIKISTAISTPAIVMLNDALSMELSVVDRYLRLAAYCRAAGIKGLTAHYEGEITEELGHASSLLDRIIALGGTPDVHRMDMTSRIPVPMDIVEILKQDLEIEREAMRSYAQRISTCIANNEHSARKLFEEIYEEEFEAVGWCEQQLDMIQMIGLPAYLQIQMKA